MKAFSYLLLTAGTIVGSLGGGKLPEADPTLTGVGLLLLIIGGVVFRLNARRSGGGAGLQVDTAASRGQARELLAALAQGLDELAATDPTNAALTAGLSKLELSCLIPIGDLAPALLRELGPATYAEVFGSFASGERFFARAWSAAADQHKPESMRSIGIALERFRFAAEHLGPA